MNPEFPVKEYTNYLTGLSSSPSNSWHPSEELQTQPPQPIEGLHETGPPPFLTKTFDMVEDLATDDIVSWSRGGHSFVVWDPCAFSNYVLPRYFKHSNFTSFVRQLNTYGFRKVDPDKWEFANEAFLKGQRHFLKNIRRRKSPSHPLHMQQGISPCVELGSFGSRAEYDRLVHDKQILMMEIVKLRQQQQIARSFLQKMEVRLQISERKQQQIMSFLVRAMQNPELIHKVIEQKKRKEYEDSMSINRQKELEGPVKIEPLEFTDHCGSEVSELEALALEMQGYGKGKREKPDELEELGGFDKELDEGFWEELLHQGSYEEQRMIRRKKVNVMNENVCI